MAHPLDEAIAEARRALALDATMVAKAKALEMPIPKRLVLERDRFFEKWTRIEKALVEARERDLSMATAAIKLLSLREKATPGPWRRAHHGTFEVEGVPNQVVADCGSVGRAEADRDFIVAMENALHEAAKTR